MMIFCLIKIMKATLYVSFAVYERNTTHILKHYYKIDVKFSFEKYGIAT